MTRLTLALAVALAPAVASASIGPDLTLESAFGAAPVALALSTPQHRDATGVCALPAEAKQLVAADIRDGDTIRVPQGPYACNVPLR